MNIQLLSFQYPKDYILSKYKENKIHKPFLYWDLLNMFTDGL